MASADRLIEVFNEAKARPPGAERDQYLAVACRDEPALKEQVLLLLKAHEGAGSFLQRRTQLLPLASPLTEKPGDRIGRYKLLEQIGEGGCGVVYMAEQEEPVRRRVALKVIKLGMDTKQVIARFEAERQALAMMDHPNIAKVLDGGATDTGRPFFVMELVRGIKITEYCDQNNLSTKERLELFMQVCQAIQHAHQKGIIHRDIKPSNILVTQHDDVAVPKVIDFGIAKATIGQLTDKTVFTAFAQFIGTPAYMSPEQAQMSGLDIDTRADIYSLGVLLYELLTSNTPFDAKKLLASGMDEMRRKICEDEPAKPSTCLSTMLAMDLTTVAEHRHVEPPRLIHLIRGDLDWLVMKCLEKDRTRRYETANGLAADIQRHLSNEPITARPPSRLYEFQKSVHRHKFGFAAAAALIVVLGLGVLASTWQAVRATRAERDQNRLRGLAENEAAKSQQVAQFMQDMLKGVGPAAALGRDTAMLREILDKTAERIATDLKNRPDVEAELRNSIGAVYWELGAYDKASAMHLQALTMQRKLVGSEHPSVATSLHYLAQALREQGKLAESEAAHRESLAMRRKLLGIEHSDVARSLNDLGSLLSIELKNDEPEALLREALAIRRKLYGNEHGDVARSLDDLAHVLNRHGQAAEAVAMHYEALAIRKRVFGDVHPELIYSYRNLARALQGQGKLAEAETMLRDAMLVSQKLLGQQYRDMPGIRSDLGSLLRAQGKLKEAEILQSELDVSSQTVASSLYEAGKYLQQQGRLAEAETNYREALALKKQLLGDNHREIVNALTSLGLVLHHERKLADAEAAYREVLTVERKLSGGEHPLVASSMHQLAVVLQESGKSSEAESVFRETVGMRRKLFGNENGEVADSMIWIGVTLSGQGKHAEAEGMLRDALQIGKKIPSWENWVANALLVLGYELREQGKLNEAETAYREAVAIRRKLFGKEHLELAYAIHSLAGVLNQPGKQREAEVLAREVLAMRRTLLGNEHPEVAASLRLLWELLAAQGKARELESLLREQPGAETSATESAQAQFGHVLWQLGDSYLQSGQFKEAERVYDQSLQKFKQLQVQFPTNALYRQEQAYSLRLVSDVMQRSDRLAEAEASLRTAWDIYTQLVKEVPASPLYHREAAFTRRRVAEVLSAQGKHDEAEVMCRDDLAMQKKLFGDVHREVDTALGSLARVLRQEGKLAEAEAVWREELAMERKLSGDEHPFVANSLHSLVAVLRDSGKLTEAETVCREALAMRRKLLGDEDPAVASSLLWLASVLEEQGKLAEAETLFRERLTIIKKLSGNEHPDVIAALAELTRNLLAQKKFTEAEPTARECLAIREKKLPDDWRTFNTRSMLGGSLLGQKKYAEAEPLLLSSYEGMKQREDKIPAIGKARLPETLQRLVQLYEATGQTGKAAEWNRKLTESDQAAKKSAAPKP